MSDTLHTPGRPLHVELGRLLTRAEVLKTPGVPRSPLSLASKIGRRKSIVYKYLDGSQVPPLDVLLNILTVMGVSSERFAYYETLHEQAVAKPKVSLDNLATPREGFIGRDVAALGRAIGDFGCVVVHGDSGVGKSELALQYAHGWRTGKQRTIWWIKAGSAQQITAGLADLARALNPGKVFKDMVAAEWAIKWARLNDSWLMIFDDVTRFDDVSSVLNELSGSGSILMTSTLTPVDGAWQQAGVHPLPLSPLERDASATFLLERTGSRDREGARLLAAEQGDLPLALQQAAAFLNENPELGFRGFRQLLIDRRDQVEAAASGTGKMIAATLSVLLERAATAAPLSSEVLSVMSYLAGEAPLAETVLAPLGEGRELAQSLEFLADYGLIERSGGEITIHRLVQAATRADDRAPAVHRAKAAELLDSSLPDDPMVTDWHHWRLLTAHLEALFARMPAEEQTVSSVHLRERFASYLQGQGYVSRAIAIFEAVVRDADRLLGQDHAIACEYAVNLASAYVAAARITPGLALLKDLLPRAERVYGPGAQEVLQVRGLLANAYRARGYPDMTVAVFEQIIAEAGGTELDLGTTQALLGMAYADAGRYDDAIRLLTGTYAEQRQSLGDTNPKTLITRHNLARARRETGDLEEALAEFRKVELLQATEFGSSNWYTLTTRGNIALTEQAMGRVEAAVEQFEALLVDTQEELGREHPATLTTSRYLGNAHLANGEIAEAIALLERAVADHRSLLGDSEPLTFLARRDLAAAYEHGAVSMYTALLSDQERVLGPEHQATNATRRSLAGLTAAHASGGSADEAEPPP